MSRYHIEVAVNDDGEGWWNILEEQDDSRLICIAQCPIETKANEVLNALRWLEAMGGARLSLAMDGITIDANTGRVRTSPKRKRVPAPKTKPAKKRPRS